MLWLVFLVPWILVGIGVIFVAFSGGPSRARHAYLTRASGTFKIAILVIYLGIGVGVPVVIAAERPVAQGATSRLETKDSSSSLQSGKALFRNTCASCHTLAAINARGVTGPDLDRIGKMTPARVLNAIKIGGTGQGRMPSGLLQGKFAQEVADYVSAVAGNGG
jgi:cytochrome c551